MLLMRVEVVLYREQEKGFSIYIEDKTNVAPEAETRGMSNSLPPRTDLNSQLFDMKALIFFEDELLTLTALAILTARQ